MSLENRVLRKIQKCLALSKSSNANEAASALRQAQAMMRQHGLTEDMVAGLEVDEDVVKTREGFGSCAFLSELGALLRDAFGVVSIMERNPGSASRANIRYVGLAGRPQLATYAHRVVTRAVDEAWAQYLLMFPGHKGDSGKRTAFRLGWLLMVRSKVMAIGFSEEEQVAIQSWKDRRFGDRLQQQEAPKLRMGADEVRLARVGARLAEDFHLHRPMEADEQPERPALEHKP